MFRVLVTDALSPAGLAILKASPGIEVDDRGSQKMTPAELRTAVSQADAMVIRSGYKLTPEILDGQTRLKAIVRAGVGVDNINLAAATRAGVVVMNTPAGNTISTAEHTVTLMMALSRHIAAAHAKMVQGEFDRKLRGTQLAGKTLAVVGLGRIGLAVAARAQALEMKVLGYDPVFSAEKAAEMGIEFYKDVGEILTKCDYVTFHTPLTPETKNLINAERLKTMKKGVRIINCARGGIVDEEALCDGLESGHVGGAALDVFLTEPLPKDSRLLKQKNILLTPHLGASTDEAQELVAVEAAEIITGFLIRNEVRHAVNMAPISATEMQEMGHYLDLAYRLGLLLARWGRGSGIRRARINFRGEAANKKQKPITASFAAGLMHDALETSVNIVNAEMMAKERGVEITESSSQEPSNFTTMITASIDTDRGELTAAGTIFGKQFLRLVKLGPYHLDAYLDGTLLIYRHRDVPGLIGYIGTECGKQQVNIAHMALGRERNEPGGDSVAVLNLDNDPSAEALAEIARHPEVQGVDLVRLPKAGAPLPWVSGN
jgi:D-3-phosphoglycerate dehydrogenase